MGGDEQRAGRGLPAGVAAGADLEVEVDDAVGLAVDAHEGPSPLAVSLEAVAQDRVAGLGVEVVQWEDILRIIGSIRTGAVRAYDVIRMR